MSTITIQDLENDLQGILHRVEEGESIIVLRGHQPVAEVRPLATNSTEPRPFGLADGEFTVPADFDAPLPEELLQGFEGP
ncbi:MAG: hypothetical protein WD851_14400 [Pirellulales bacterium]